MSILLKADNSIASYYDESVESQCGYSYIQCAIARDLSFPMRGSSERQFLNLSRTLDAKKSQLQSCGL